MTALLEARGIIKNYGHVEVLRGTDFTAEAGKVTALIGDNGAGKSTLVKILSGVIQPDGGEILMNGRPVTFSSPSQAREHGIETVSKISPWPSTWARPRTPTWDGNFCAAASSASSG